MICFDIFRAIGSLHEMSQELFSTDEMGDPKQSKKARNVQLVDLDGSGKDRDDDENYNYEEYDEGLKRNKITFFFSCFLSSF